MTAIDNIVAPKIELAIRSLNASSGRDVTSVTANSERGEHIGINASSENASGNNNTLGVSNVNDETRHNIPDEVSELSVPETHFDGQAHTHHSSDGVKAQAKYFIFLRISGKPEKPVNAAVKTIKIHVNWVFEFPLIYKIFAYTR